MTIRSVNPATGDLVRQFEPLDDAAVEDALAASVRAHERLRRMTVEDRAARLRKAADVLDEDKTRWARIATEEMGKTLSASKKEVEKCAWVCRFYADRAAEFLADEPIDAGDGKAYVRHLPLGPVLAVMPWNFPYWQVFRFAAPALAAGNSGLLKHASNVPRCALAMQEIFERAGFAKGAFQALLVEVDAVEAILSDERVRAATLTGSEGAGRAVGALAGKKIKPSVLELGGSDPFIVMPSADLEKALDGAVRGRTLNNGQSCIAAKRFLVHDEIYDTFRDALVERFEALEVGDPMAETVDVGPLATRSIREELTEQVSDSLKAGARRLTGAEPIDGPGFYFRPGILEDIPENAPVFSEEVFGPVALLFRIPDLDRAIELGNATRFGLGSSIWTSDPDEAERAVDELETGSTFVNAIVASDPRLPFGGVKASGYGRELSRDGMMAFVNRKTVSVAS